VFDVADAGKMVLALVNRVPAKQPTGDATHADVAAAIAIFNRARTNHDLAGFSAFSKADTPTGFKPERVLWPGEDPKIMVRVHHKFVVIDADGASPIVYTGSANFSNNSLHHNDENLLEITNCPRIARIYFAEFLRLYEHYRARDAYDQHEAGTKIFTLTSDASWSTKYFAAGSPEMKARLSMTGQAVV
jgi:phosphatidylserine/phosphatidylglycerophosphate/cardiolipin synthase-like enzyme